MSIARISLFTLAAALTTTGFVAPSFAAAPAPAPPIVLKIEGIAGESKDDPHNHLDVTSAPSAPVCITILGATLCISSK